MTHCEESLYQIRLLGIFEVRRNGELLNKVHRKGTKLHKAMACLILARGQSISNNELIKITGIDPKKNAETSLKVLIHRIRGMMPGEPADEVSCINKTPGGYAWNMDFGATVDLFEAESLCDSVISARKYSRINPEDLSALVELYAGDILPEMKNELWVELAQFRFGMRYTAAMTWAFSLMWKANEINQIILTSLRGLTINSMEPMFYDNLKRAKSIANQHAVYEMLREADGML